MGFTTTQARKELERINKKLKGYEALLLRQNQLETFLSLADELTKKSKAKQPEAKKREPVKITFGRTADIAARILQQHGQLHLNELHKTMRSSGWAGSGIAANEKKAIYIAMFREPNRFTRVGRNVWALRETQAKAAS
jgi:hypothetical protein